MMAMKTDGNKDILLLCSSEHEKYYEGREQEVLQAYYADSEPWDPIEYGSIHS